MPSNPKLLAEETASPDSTFVDGGLFACTVNVNNSFAYKTEYKENGFFLKECMILSENHIIELMIFSKQGVSENQFLKFVNSLKKI